MLQKSFSRLSFDFFLLTLFFVPSVVFGQSQNITSGLVGYWPMSEGSGTTTQDASGNGNNGIIATGASWVDTLVGKGLSSGENEGKVIIPSTPSLNISGNLSLSMWFKPSAEYTGYACHPIKKWTYINDANYVLYYFGQTSGSNRYMRFFANRGGVWEGVSAYTNPVNLDEWIHIALSYDTSTGGQLYINGVPFGARYGGGPLALTSSALSLGGCPGTIDEVRIYNRALAGGEILSLASLSVPEPTLPGDITWHTYRKSKNLDIWPDAFPPIDGQTRIQKSLVGGYILFSNDSYLALFSSPDSSKSRGALLGLTRRADGVELIRPSAASEAESWETCVGGNTTSHLTCANGSTVRGKNVNGTWSIKNIGGTPTMSFMYTNLQGGINLETQWQLTSRGLRGKVIADDVVSDGVNIVKVKFPMINGFGTSLGDPIQVLVPTGNIGEMYDENYTGGIYYYPSSSLNMQWVGVVNGGHALYMGSEDTSRGLKGFILGKMSHSLEPAFVEQYANGIADGSSIYGAWVDVETWPITDGWWDLARRYREFAVPTFAPTPLTARTNVPQEIIDGKEFWSIIYDTNSGNSIFTTVANELKANINHSIAFHWYNWHTPGFDLGYPNYTPKAGFSQTITNAQTTGTNTPYFVVPYFNAQSADLSDLPAGQRPACTNSIYSDSATWAPFAKISADSFNVGGKYWFLADTGTCLAEMNNYAPQWRAQMKSIVDTIIGAGAKGFYMDSTPGFNYHGSMDTSAGNPRGGGSWTVVADRSLIDHVRAGRTPFVASEFFADAYIDKIDTALDYGESRTKWTPLSNLVYNDRSIIVGPRSHSGEDEMAFALKVGRGVLTGYQPGVMSLYTFTSLPTTKAPKYALLNYLLDVIEDLQPWLAYGDLFGLLNPANGANNPQVSAVMCKEQGCTKGTDVAIESAIYGTQWNSQGGDRRIIYMNLNEQTTQTARFVTPGWLLGRSASVYESDGTKVGPLSSENGGATIVLTAPAWKVRFVALDTATIVPPPPTPSPSPSPSPSPTPVSSGGGSASIVSPPASSSVVNINSTTTIPSLIPSPIVTTSVPLPPLFLRPLYLGVSGDDVATLQQILTTEGLLTGDSITGYFGPKTQAGVQAFQAKYGIVSSGDPLSTGYGSTGPSTRKKLEERRGGSVSPSPTPAPVTPPSSTKGIILTRTLTLGSRGTDVTTLQNYLIAKGYLPAGNNTGYFGKLTEAGVKAFQKSKGLEPVGWTGPKTRVEMGR